MRTIKNWNQFNEENIYGPGWTTTSTGNIREPEQVNQQVQKPAQETPAQPVKTDNLHITNFKVPVTIERNIDESTFDSQDPRIIAERLDREGIDAWWFVDQYKRWERDARPEEPGEEPQREDFDSDDDYQSELQDYNDRQQEYDNWEATIDNYIEDEFGNWDRFLLEFQVYGSVVENTTDRERMEIFDVLQDDFNESNLVQYFDESKNLGVVDMKVVGNDFDDDSRFTIEVKSTKPLTDEDKEIVKEYISGQCSDGWGEGFEQQDTQGYSVHTWWHTDNFRNGRQTINAPNYKILVD